MTRSPRAAARRTVLRHLKTLREYDAILRAWWDVTGAVYVDQKDRQPGDNCYMRPRANGEYPEAKRVYWGATINKIDEMQTVLSQLREHALTEYHLTPEEPAA